MQLHCCDAFAVQLLLLPPLTDKQQSRHTIARKGLTLDKQLPS
jgi:hypothetical protein